MIHCHAKALPLRCLYSYRKPRWAEVGQTYIHIRRNCRFGFDSVRTSQTLNCWSRTKQRERLMRCIIYSPHWLRAICRSLSRVLSIYVHRRGAFGVARFDNLGDARAFTAWNEWQNRLHIFMYIYYPFVKHANMVAIGIKQMYSLWTLQQP